MGFVSWLRYCTDVAERRSTKLCTMFGQLLHWYTAYIFGGSCSLIEFCQVQNSHCVQVSHSPILAALLHGTPAVGVSQTLWRGTRNGITELSLLIFLIECATYISRAATLGIGPHSSFSYSFKCETKFNEQTVSKTILTNSLVKFNNRSLHCHRCSLHSHFIRLQAVRQYKLPLHSSVTVMVSLTANSAMAHRAHLRDSCHDL